MCFKKRSNKIKKMNPKRQQTNGLDWFGCDNPKILILGTMPGKQSRTAGEYYSNKNNCFWEMIATICGKKHPLNEIQKKQCLNKLQIVLWDVYKSCEIQGSLDKNIRNPKLNDFDEFFKKYGRINKIVFNVKKPMRVFRKNVKGCEIIQCTAPSTSSSNSHLTKDKKIEEWKKYLKPQ